MAEIDSAMEEKLLGDDQNAEGKKEGDTMDTSENSGESELVEVKKADDEEPEEEEDAEGKEKPAEKREEENTLLTNAIKGPIRLSVVLIKDLSNHDLHQVLHRCSKATLEMERRRGVLTLWFDPWRSIGALAILKKLAKLQLSGEDFKMECPKALASMLGTQKIKEKYPDSKFGNKNKTLYVHDVPPETSEEILRVMFPDVSSVNLPVDKEGKKLGVAILDFVSGKDCNAALERNPEIQILDTNCTVDWYFPAPEDVEEPKERQKKQHRDQTSGWRKRNRGGGYGGNFRGAMGGGGGGGGGDGGGGGGGFGGGFGGFPGNRGRGNHMVHGGFNNNKRYSPSGQGVDDFDQGFRDNFENYQSGYYDDDYSAPNKRMKGNRGNRRGGGGNMGGNMGNMSNMGGNIGNLGGNMRGNMGGNMGNMRGNMGNMGGNMGNMGGNMGGNMRGNMGNMGGNMGGNTGRNMGGW
nr:heterogeneous nuclear ribonucleoprotein 87F isoform X2 [Crassostrea gigas]